MSARSGQGTRKPQLNRTPIAQMSAKRAARLKQEGRWQPGSTFAKAAPKPRTPSELPVRLGLGVQAEAGAREAGKSAPKRRKPLPYRSKKTAARYVTRRQIVAEMFADPEVCEVPWCTEMAADPHEPLTRARGGDILDRANIRKVCHGHNVMFSADEQPWMYRLGFLVHSWGGAA